MPYLDLQHFSIENLRTNILLDGHFVAKLGDFGFARRKPQIQGGRSFWMGETCGTQGYTAPEVASGEVSPKADIYAFGIVSELQCMIYYTLYTTNDPATCR